MTDMTCKICGGNLSPFLTSLFDDRHGCPGQYDICRCSQCGFGQTLPEFPLSEIGDLYTTYYPRKNLDINKLAQSSIRVPSRLTRWWLGINNTAHYHIKPGNRVLDIGCGDCTSLREINAMGGEGHGIEPDRNVAELARILGLSVHIGLFDEMPYLDNSFDCITMSQVLEHFHEPLNLLLHLKKVLKNDGRLIIGVPNIDSRLNRQYGSRWLNWHVPYHINHFSRRSLEILAGQAGFRILEIRTITPNLWVELQKRLFAYPVAEGKRVPFLNGEPDNGAAVSAQGHVNKVSKIRALYRRLTGAFGRRFNLLRIFSLRLDDALGNGESFLVILEKGH